MTSRASRDGSAGGHPLARSTQRPLAPDLGDLPRRRSAPQPGQASAQAQAQSSSALAQARAQWSSALAPARAQWSSALAQARAQWSSALAQARAQPLSVLARARWLSGSVLALRRWLPVRVRAQSLSGSVLAPRRRLWPGSGSGTVVVGVCSGSAAVVACSGSGSGTVVVGVCSGSAAVVACSGSGSGTVVVGVCSGSAAVVVAGWGARSGSEAHDEASSDSAAAARTAAVSLDDGAMSGPVIRGGRCSQALTRVVGPRSAGPEAPHNCRRCRQHCQRSSDHTNAGRNRR